MAALEHVPVINQARAPGRHIVLVMMVLGVLAGAGWEAVAARRWRIALLFVLAFEYAAVPFPLLSTAMSPAHDRLAQVTGDYAVLELPLEVRDGGMSLGQRNAEQMWGQTRHGHPIVGGAVSRLPEATVRRLAEAPVVGTLLNPVGVTRGAQARDQSDGGEWLRRHRIAAVVVHNGPIADAQRRYLEGVLPVVARERFWNDDHLLWLQDPGEIMAASPR
jgi:hypothetical protein